MFRLTPASSTFWSHIRAYFAAAVIVVAILGGMGGTPAITALIAGAADQHQISWGTDPAHFHLVLSHDEPPSAGHRHTMGSRIAMLLGRVTTGPTGDHVLQFERFGEVVRASRPVGVDPAALPPSVLIGRVISLPSVRMDCRWPRRAESQWGGRGIAVQPGRSTVRLI